MKPSTKTKLDRLKSSSSLSCHNNGLVANKAYRKLPCRSAKYFRVIWVLFYVCIINWTSEEESFIGEKASEEMKAIEPYRWEINLNYTHASTEKEIIYKMVQVLRILRLLVFLTLIEMIIKIRRRRRNMWKLLLVLKVDDATSELMASNKWCPFEDGWKWNLYEYTKDYI